MSEEKKLQEKQQVIGNPHLEGYKRCSYCKKYFDESKPHSCYLKPTVTWSAHNRKRKNVPSDK